MQIGMNLENVVDWSPAWTFTDAFKASRGWITHEIDTTTWQMAWDVGATNPVQVDANGDVTRLTSRTVNGHTIKQMAGTLMFRDLDGAYPAGVYHAEWDGTGIVTFGFDATTIATGRTAAGRSYADLQVTPGSNGIYLRIEETNPSDPVRGINIWMPPWEEQSFAGRSWHPGDGFSPFHPLFLQRLSPFGVIRFMAPQETNTSDIRTWADRRDANDIRQGSGSDGSPSEPIANGMSLEYMVQLANDLHADPWFNMPHMADDTFVRNFATYVRDHLDPGLTAYVEWSNEIWNFGWGFEASAWVQAQTSRPEYTGLDNWQVAGREAKRDLDIWTNVFAGQTNRLVRVAAGWAANDWVTGRIVESMSGSFDAIAIAPYFSPDDDMRASYTSSTTVDRVLADCRTAIDVSVGWVRNHQALADDWTGRLGRDIRLVAYEGGQHLDGRSGPYQTAFYQAANDPRMGDLYRTYLTALDAAGMDLYVDYVLTGQAGASSWGDFAKLHRMDESLATAYRYTAVVEAATGALWGTTDIPLIVAAGSTLVDATSRSGDVRLVKRGPGTLVLTASSSYTGGLLVEEGTVVIRSTAALGTGSLTIAAGGLVTLDTSTARVSAGALDIATGGRLEVGRGGLQIAGGGVSSSTIISLLREGRADDWSGARGITSQPAASRPFYGVGWMEQGDGSITLAFAAAGDTNLDGLIDLLDASTIIGSAAFNTAQAVGWSAGDFTADGVVDVLDIVEFLGAALYDQGDYRHSLAAGIAATVNAESSRVRKAVFASLT